MAKKVQKVVVVVDISNGLLAYNHHRHHYPHLRLIYKQKRKNPKSFSLMDESKENGLSEMGNLSSSQLETQEGMIRTTHHHSVRYRATDIAYILKKRGVVAVNMRESL